MIASQVGHVRVLVSAPVSHPFALKCAWWLSLMERASREVLGELPHRGFVALRAPLAVYDALPPEPCGCYPCRCRS